MKTLIKRKVIEAWQELADANGMELSVRELLEQEVMSGGLYERRTLYASAGPLGGYAQKITLTTASGGGGEWQGALYGVPGIPFAYSALGPFYSDAIAVANIDAFVRMVLTSGAVGDEEVSE